ncbi:MAG: cytochrome b/b6 domain-containing protein [Lysobacterales bacterium]|nr:MAG: cytochrome b/b6 domain-containing protein [Xanthomonadales bacterium]
MAAAAGGADRQHLAVALVTSWLVVTSPWIGMLRRIPSGAGWLDYAHVALGLVVLAIGCTYAWHCTRDGRWPLYFPVTPPHAGQVGRDVAGLLRGRVPASEGGGLFGLIEGLLLVALLATGATGAAWLAAQGGELAPGWRDAHIVCARLLIGLLVAHVITVSLHLLDFVRD